MKPLPPEVEAAAGQLAQRFELAPGFDLALLFLDTSDVAAVLRERLEVLLHLRTSRLEVVCPESPGEAESQVVSRIEAGDGPRLIRAPLWLELNRGLGDPAWDAAREAVLAALNRRRGYLQSVFSRPLVVVLPQGYQPEVWRVAADLWTVRGFSRGFDTPSPPSALSDARAFPGSGELPLARQVDAAELAKDPVISEWMEVAERLDRGGIDAARIDALLPLSAARRALAAGDYPLAERFAAAALMLTTARVADGSPSALRQAGLAEATAGDVAQALDRWEEAGQRYGRSLAYRERLREAVGEVPEVLDDLGLSLLRLAQLGAPTKSAPDAMAYLDRAAAIYERLASAPGDVPAYREKLAVIAELRRRSG